MSSSNFQAIYVLWLRQIKRFFRARSRLVANLVQPFFFLMLFGFGFGFIRFEGNLNYLDFLAPGIIAMSVVFSSMFAGVSVIWDKQFGFLKEVLVAPVSRLTIVIGQTLGGSTLAIVQGLTVLGISMLLGVKINLWGIIPALIFMALMAFFSVSMGLIIASKLDDFQGFQLIMNLLIFPLIFLSSAFFPIETAPDVMKGIMLGDPLTYAVDGLRGFLIGSFALPIYIDFIVIVAFSVALLLIGAFVYSRSEYV
ncbi:MAG: ABC transporter permease [Candidatus Methylarchaceae archaeon HK02M1]|nr:ABC transporter permease [Candidatus Methylarchaceae archaeon HK01M]MCP8311906.1 ABC transporter permease [Candidatus Methylarchaceae archaeon HK02M1]